MALCAAPIASCARSPISVASFGRHAAVGEGDGEQVALVGIRSVELAAVDALEPARQLEMIEDPIDVDLRLARRHEERSALLRERFEYIRDPLVDLVLEEADVAEALAIERHAARREVFAHELHEALVERRTDTPLELVFGRDRRAQPLQGVLDAPRNPGPGSVSVPSRSKKIEWVVIRGRT